MLRWSFGEKIFVGVPEEYASLPEAGTTVRVEGLWGDMPVRIKARAGADMEREWGEVIRAALGLLLSGRGRGVGLVVRDENGARKLGIKAEFRGAWDLAVLRQGVGEDVVGSERDWECVKARQNGVRIEGWICSRGIGSRNVQFLAVNGFPLMNETELHREINRVFSASSFGTIEETENGRRAPTRKGVERKGMFVLRIECRGGAALGGEGGTDGKAGVEGEVSWILIPSL